MSSILEEIETKIEGLKTSTTKSNVGVVRETGDGVARIEGLSDVMLNEMIEFPNGVYGLALNLEETEVGAILLGETTKVSEGDEVKTTGKLLSVPVGKALLGRVVNTLGQPLDDKAGGPFRFYIPNHKACHTDEIDECANVKFVDRLEFTAEKGFDNRPHDEAEHADLHAKQS